MRMTRDQPWQRTLSAAAAAESAVGDRLRMGHRPARLARRAGPRGDRRREERPVTERCRQEDRPSDGKDYLVFPALSRSRWRRTLARERRGQRPAQSVGVRGDLLRALSRTARRSSPPPWSSRKPSPTGICAKCWVPRTSTPARCWRSPSGNLCYQIEHHLFPDLPSNRYAEIATRVRALCDKYDLPYTTGSLRANT